MRYSFYTLDVFTDQRFGGNQLAVLPEARGLTAQQMQQIAREFNYSETVFMFPPEQPDHTRRVRIFTPGAEVPFAGHPTVGAAFVLGASGAVALTGERTQVILEENVGPVPVTIFARAGQPVGAQLTTARLPEFGPPPPASAALAEMLSLAPEDLRSDEFTPQAASCGLPFLIVPLQNRDALARARLRRDVWEQVLANEWAPWPYLICFDPELPTSQVRARMFAPDVGVEEDPATGSAAAALAGYLGVRDPTTTGTLRWVVEQGFEMGRPSILEVEADKHNGAITAVRVGGACVLVSEGVITI